MYFTRLSCFWSTLWQWPPSTKTLLRKGWLLRLHVTCRHHGHMWLRMARAWVRTVAPWQKSENRAWIFMSGSFSTNVLMYEILTTSPSTEVAPTFENLPIGRPVATQGHSTFEGPTQNLLSWGATTSSTRHWFGSHLCPKSPHCTWILADFIGTLWFLKSSSVDAYISYTYTVYLIYLISYISYILTTQH